MLLELVMLVKMEENHMDIGGNTFPKMNRFQTELTEELVNSLPQEVQDQLFDIINNVEFVKRLISPTREYAKDRPRDDRGRIIVDLANPHILEDMDYFRPSAIHYEKYGTFTNLRPNANPNSEYGKWVREERRRIWDGYVRESDGEWVTGYMYWFLNYSPMMLSKIREYKDKNGKKRKSKRADRVEALPECWEGIYWRFHCLDQASNGGLYNNFEGGQHMAELASRGKGKAHPYNEIVYTPKGKKLWGDIKIGDLLYDENGGTTKVIDIPFNDVAPIYEVKFSNGETVRCSEGHLWEVKSHDDHDKTFILSTKELLSKFRRPKKITPRAPKGYENNYTIINAIGVEMPKVNTNIDPYTFGLLLGDGCFRQPLAQNRAYFTSSDEDFETYSKLVPYNHKKGAGKYEYTFEIPKFGDYLKSVGLYMAKSEDKFIPDEYKYNSKEVRVNLLKGLLDSDGTATGGRIELVLTSKRLIDDVKWILSSLGISYTKERVKHTFYYDRNRNKVPCKNAYRLSIFSNLELFNLNRKLALWRARSMSNYGQSKYRGIKIVDIRYIGEEKAKCVTVDSPTHKYLIGTFIPTHNSYSLASILNHIFVVGENEEAHEKVKGIVTAYQKEYLTKDGVLNKFVDMANFCATNTQFPRKRLKNSLQEMTWIMGYKDVELDIERGTQNTVLGVSSKDDESKLRGKRAAKILIEEFGTFPRLVDLYNVLLPSVQEGDIVFGQIYMLGTAGDNESDFAGAQEIMYNPKGYNMYALPNVFDKYNQGKPYFVFFFPGYVNRKGCYNENGVSDVIKALIEILMNRYRVKYNSTDPNTIIKTIAEVPITPAEAIVKTGINMFPVADLTERIGQLDANPTEYDDVYVGDLVFSKDGQVEYKPTSATPIRDFPHKDNKIEGAIEIYQMPEIDKNTGKPYNDRYILGADPYDDDESNTMSLGSIFVLDLWTDRIVAEYTGRPPFADDYYEICRKLCLFYNGRLNYEYNKKGLFSHFSTRNSLYLLTDVLNFLKEKQMMKDGYGNKSKGTNASPAINAYARSRLRSWLLVPVPIMQTIDGEEKEVMVPRLFTVRNRALLKELINYNSEGNFDRISAMGMLMLLREDRMIRYQGDVSKEKQERANNSYDGNDPFFKRNYDFKFRQ
jgi:hypothetical protein